MFLSSKKWSEICITMIEQNQGTRITRMWIKYHAMRVRYFCQKYSSPWFIIQMVLWISRCTLLQRWLQRHQLSHLCVFHNNKCHGRSIYHPKSALQKLSLSGKAAVLVLTNVLAHFSVLYMNFQLLQSPYTRQYFVLLAGVTVQTVIFTMLWFVMDFRDLQVARAGSTSTWPVTTM